MISIDKSVRRLAGAAGALAAGLGGAQSLDAAVVHQTVNVNIPTDANTYLVDLNGDAVKEFDIESDISGTNARIKATNYGTNVGSLRDAGDGAPANLSAGTLIGPGSGTYSSTGIDTLTGIESGNPAGHFQVSDGPGYLGIQFPIGGQTHYGYVGYEGTGAQNSANGRVYSLGYETTPNTAIAAGAVPEPSTIAMLAAGASGMALYRRRRHS
jgi:hypothetical protein